MHLAVATIVASVTRNTATRANNRLPDFDLDQSSVVATSGEINESFIDLVSDSPAVLLRAERNG
jgi:hypothetical protein